MRTCVVTISCWNNFAHVLTFLEAAVPRNDDIDCWIWGVADRAEFVFGTSALVSKEAQPWTKRLRDRLPSFLRVVTLEELQKFVDFPVLELAFKYNLVEFNTAIKSLLFYYAFDVEMASRVLYFDNDCWILDSLKEIELLLDQYSAVATPHITSPNPLDGFKQTDIQIGMAGIFNFGFLGLSDSTATRAFLEWWTLRLRFYGFVDQAHGMHFDQGWGDFLPVFFDHDDFFVLRDPRFNLAYWNLHYLGDKLALSTDKKKALVDGEPVVFFHFSGISNYRFFRSHDISRHQSRYTLFDVPAMGPILDEYTRLLETNNASKYRKIPYGFDYLDSGVRIIPAMRALFAEIIDPDADPRRQRYFLRNVDLRKPFRGPGKPELLRRRRRDKLSVMEWMLAGPSFAAFDLVGDEYFPELVAFIAKDFYFRDKDKVKIPPPPAIEPPYYSVWLWLLKEYLPRLPKGTGASIHAVVAASLKQHRADLIEVSNSTFGVDLLFVPAGASAARSLQGLFCQGRIPHGTIELPSSSSSEDYDDDNNDVCLAAYRRPQHSVTVVVTTWDAIPALRKHLTTPQKKVGFLLGNKPSRMHLALFDEIWVPSPDVAEAIRGGPPVFVVPPIGIVKETPRRRRDLSLTAEAGRRQTIGPDAFVFLAVVDYRSMVDREKVLGAVTAFARAFPSSGEEIHLVVECRMPSDMRLGGDSSSKSARQKKMKVYKIHEELLGSVAVVRNAHVVDSKRLTATQKVDLRHRADCVVALDDDHFDLWTVLASGRAIVASNRTVLGTAYADACVKHPSCETTTPWIVATIDDTVRAMRSIVQDPDRQRSFAAVLAAELRDRVPAVVDLVKHRIFNLSSGLTPFTTDCQPCATVSSIRTSLSPAPIFPHKSVTAFLPEAHHSSVVIVHPREMSPPLSSQNHIFVAETFSLCALVLVIIAGFSPAVLRRRCSRRQPSAA